MAYTPPAYNAADLTLVSGYSAPAYNAVDFSWQFDPIASLVGSSTVSFSAVAVAGAALSAVGAAATTFAGVAFPTSTMNISSATTVTFETSERGIEISAATGGVFAGRAVVTSSSSASGSATAYFERYYPPPIQGATTFAPFGGGIVSTFFYSRGKAGGVLAGSFEKQTKFVVRGLSRMDGESNSVAVSAAAIGSSAIGGFSARAVSAAQASVSGSAIWTTIFGGVRGAQGSVSGSSAAAFLGDRVGAGIFSAQGSSVLSLAGAYSTVEVSQYNASSDVVYVVTSQHEIVAYGI
jgi:hypothetical protein